MAFGRRHHRAMQQFGLRNRFHVEVHDGEDLTVHGNSLDHELAHD